MSGPPLDWVERARVLLTEPDVTLDEIAAWLGEGIERDGDSIKAGAGALPGASTVTVHGRDGIPASLAAWYSGETGPTLGEAEATLGAAEALPRLRTSPPQVAFASYTGAAASCYLGGTTWDPVSVGAARRLFQLTLRRDPLA